jgi:hypothetical protein
VGVGAIVGVRVRACVHACLCVWEGMRGETAMRLAQDMYFSQSMAHLVALQVSMTSIFWSTGSVNIFRGAISQPLCTVNKRAAGESSGHGLRRQPPCDPCRQTVHKAFKRTAGNKLRDAANSREKG